MTVSPPNTRPDDLREERQAAALLTDLLQGAPLVGTSGDEMHQLFPSHMRFTTGLTSSGETLHITFANPDRHHPGLVYQTVQQRLNTCPALEKCALRAPSPEDCNPELGEMTVHYDVPAGEVDHIIHALSEAAKEQGLGEFDTSWVRRIDTNTPAALLSSPPKNTGWLRRLLCAVTGQPTTTPER